MGGAPGSTNVSQQANIPDELKPLINGSVGWTLGLQNNLPLSQFTQWSPRGVAGLSPLQAYGMQNIPGLFGTEPAYTGAFQTMATLPELTARPLSTPPAELASIAQLNDVVGGPVGSSPATRQAMEAWRQFTLPTVQHEAALQGVGRSGQELIDTALSSTQAMVPLLQTEIANRMQSAKEFQNIAGAETSREQFPREQTAAALTALGPQLTNLGTQMFNQRVQAIDEALRGGQINRDVAQQEFDAAREEFSRLQALSEAGTLGPLGQVLPSLIGSKTNTQKDLYSAVLGK